MTTVVISTESKYPINLIINEKAKLWIKDNMVYIKTSKTLHMIPVDKVIRIERSLEDIDDGAELVKESGAQIHG
jgi:hypothetical protein